MLTRSLISRNAHAWCVLVAVSAIALSGCGRAGGATPGVATEAAHASSDSPADQDAARLTALRKSGELAAWVDASLETTPGPQTSARLFIRAEALLASGRSDEAQTVALEAAQQALSGGDTTAAEQSLKLWVTARWRGGQPLDSAEFTALLGQLPPAADTAHVLGFWRDALAGQPAFAVTNELNSPSQVPLASAAAGSLPAELNAIEVQAGGAALPLVFIDTGAQHTLITVEAAKAAGVRIGPGATRLVGFGGIDARPGVLDALQIGGLTVRNVPVLVGNSAPLKALRGQMSLGTELMHHVRLTIDYPRREVWAAAASTPDATAASPARWEIPLWTLPQAILAEGTLPSGHKARVLVDTGDRAGTFISARWARRNLAGFHRSNAPIVFKFKRRDLMIPQLELGNQSLVDWPVLDTMPHELERLDLVDVLVGHDVLWPYRVTIDLQQRLLRLEGEAPQQALTGASDEAADGNSPGGAEQESK